MVAIVVIGVLSIQGSVSEHIDSLRNTFKDMNLLGTTVIVRNSKHIDEIDALIIPGGESTTISKFLYKSDIYKAIKNRVKKKNISIMGTCAGCVLLAKRIVNNQGEVTPLNIMDIEIERNAFGRQKESFEENIKIKGLSNPYHAVFIRAPIITKVEGACEVLAELDKKIVAARQDNILAFSFHPELTNDFRIHKLFLESLF